MKEVYIAAARRTAIGSFLGTLSGISASDLGAAVIKDIISGMVIDPIAVDEVIMGQVITGGCGQNPARQSLIKAGLPKSVPGFTINKVCGSGLKSVMLAAQTIKCGEAEMIIAGGQENMSLGHHGSCLRSGSKFGDMTLIDHMMYDGLTDVFSGHMMGITAENISKQFGISREEQDEFALNSQMKASKAIEKNVFANEIVGLEVKVKKEKKVFAQDEGPRRDSSLEGLAKLRPAFDPAGTVTAGNASTINDGAAALLIVSESALRTHNLTPLARIKSYANAGVDPSIMGTGPVPASKLALQKAGWNVDDLDYIEANEAFAVQAIYVNNNMGWDESKVNVNGGAIALGHPIGASGARVLTTLVHQLVRGRASKGLATLCIGGGMGVAICIEKP